MFRSLKQVFISLLSFSGSGAHMVKFSNVTKCISPNKERCIARHTLIDLNP